jgi:hypothetical protein
MTDLPDEVVLTSTGRAKVATFDEAELAVRLFEACFEVKRPTGATLQDCIERIQRGSAGMDGDAVWESCLRMARRSLTYYVERMQAATDAETTH